MTERSGPFLTRVNKKEDPDCAHTCENEQLAAFAHYRRRCLHDSIPCCLLTFCLQGYSEYVRRRRICYGGKHIHPCYYESSLT